MKQILFFTCFIALLVYTANAQVDINDYTTISVNKQVKEFANPYDNKTPLNAFVSYIYTVVNGKQQEMNELSSIANKRNYSDETQEKNEWLLDRNIKEIIIYKDSVAGILLPYDKTLHTIWYFYFENEQWLNAGEDYGDESIETTRQIFSNKADNKLKIIRKISQLEKVSTDTTAFIRYLQENGKQPEMFLIDVFSRYKLVVYGETHNQKASWDLMKRLIHRSDFTQFIGTVFLELSLSAQTDLDHFLNNKTKEPEIILDIFRKEEMVGWSDTKDMFEFILDIWDINEQLAKENKIKLIAADFQRPFYTTITTKEQYNAFYEGLIDRNVCMADIIEKHIDTTTDKRNCLFIVGSGHAYKSSAINRAYFQQIGQSAVSLLLERLPKKSVFSIITHCPMVSNNGYLYGKLRKGIFDYVFTTTKNQPVAFCLHDSPFGNELFDADLAICFQPNTGTYADNFDGYIFLEPLETEQKCPYLYELYSNDFVREIKRRALIIGKENDIYWNIKVKDLSPEQIISILKKDEGLNKWNFEKKQPCSTK